MVTFARSGSRRWSATWAAVAAMLRCSAVKRPDAPRDSPATGDVANALLGRRVRVEHWDTAIGQGETAARSMLGQDTTYDRLPYFFTDQYDLGMEYVGSVGPDGYDEVVVRGDTTDRTFTAFWLSGGRLVAAMHANDWDATDHLRRIVGHPTDPARLRDEHVPLANLAEGRPLP